MAISKEDELIEKKHLKDVSLMLDKQIKELGNDIKIGNLDLVEFKKLVWQDSSSFDSGDIVQAKASTDVEENRIIQKEKYFKKLFE